MDRSPLLASSSAFALGFPPEGHFTDRFDLWLRFVAVTNFFVAVVAAAATLQPFPCSSIFSLSVWVVNMVYTNSAGNNGIYVLKLFPKPVICVYK